MLRILTLNSNIALISSVASGLFAARKMLITLWNEEGILSFSFKIVSDACVIKKRMKRN